MFGYFPENLFETDGSPVLWARIQGGTTSSSAKGAKSAFAFSDQCLWSEYTQCVLHTLHVQERQYIPAEDMGDYEEYKKKKSPKKSGPLYPLNEEVNSDFKKRFPQLQTIQYTNISKNLDLLQPRAHMAPHQPHCPSPCPDTRRGRGSPRCTPAMPSPATATCTPTS